MPEQEGPQLRIERGNINRVTTRTRQWLMKNKADVAGLGGLGLIALGALDSNPYIKGAALVSGLVINSAITARRLRRGRNRQ